MTREDIIRMAREAYGDWYPNAVPPELERFATLVAAAEREACARVCEDQIRTYLKNGERWLKGVNGRPDARLKDLAPDLEKAWEMEQVLKNSSVVESMIKAYKTAALIRARGNDD